MHEAATDVFLVRLSCLKEMLFFRLTFPPLKINKVPPNNLVTLSLTGEAQS